MQRSRAQLIRRRKRSKPADSSAIESQAVITQMHNSDPTSGVSTVLRDWERWWQSVSAEGFAHQQEALEWWSGLFHCYAQTDCRRQKILSLCQNLFAASMSASESVSRLALEQQHIASKFIQNPFEHSRAWTPSEIRGLPHDTWSRVTEMLRAWVMVPVSSHGRVISAWEEFWSAPSPDTAEC